MKCIKMQNRSLTMIIIETLQNQLNESIFLKRLEDAVLNKHKEVNQKKDCQLYKFKIK